MMESLQFSIVTDGLWRKSVSAIRALGKSHIKVIVMGDSWPTPGFWTWQTYKRVIAPTAAQNQDVFYNALAQVANATHPASLFPMEEATLEVVSKRRDELKSIGLRFVIPDHQVLKIALDKSQTIQYAHQLNIPVPYTSYPQTANELWKSIKSLEEGTYVVKPIHGSGSNGINYGSLNTETEAEDYWKKFGPAIVQERIPATGEAIGVSLLFDRNSECVASFVHKRLFQYPNSGGPSTDRISIHNDQLKDYSIHLLKSLRWQGIAMVEWKMNPRTNQPVLMEINPRFWGSLELAVRSGVNFPVLYHQLCEGRAVSPIHKYKLDVRCRWLIPGDILRYLTSKTREPLFTFLKGIITHSEEFDLKDIPGSVAIVVCTFLNAINPKYWKYLRRG